MLLKNLGCFVRLCIGFDSQRQVSVYRLCQITDVIPWHKTYKVTDNTWSNKALKVKSGKDEMEFTMEIVSNQNVTQRYSRFVDINQEYSRYLTTLESCRVGVPFLQHIQQKVADLYQAKNYVLNNKVVNETIEKKRALKGSYLNATKEKAQLLARREHAKSHNEVEMVIKLTKKLGELEGRIASAKGSNQTVLAGISSNNRKRNRAEAHEAELRNAKAKRRRWMESVKGHTEIKSVAATEASLNPEEEASRKRLAKLVKLLRYGLNDGHAASYQTDYEKLVSRIAMEVQIELLSDSEN
ncbi:uncharacterized protein EV154DRAFT_479876 [Mucor mucedo]|uniref:uncharacterized protein n=1 Tax=Mucor mucedo TaxID=29922 RepID=UPI00221ECB27|nr:uncharacterized protein EV154DRAFT_479876 [Mucor mucedo]KAI7892965.1 hypothetical protein EV154DRAFT_479876 [Mucor mucedo]